MHEPMEKNGKATTKNSNESESTACFLSVSVLILGKAVQL